MKEDEIKESVSKIIVDILNRVFGGSIPAVTLNKLVNDIHEVYIDYYNKI